jgi:dTDP-4-amino-4,6-dideoxygalactose transaminase/predicted dehydrogenase
MTDSTPLRVVVVGAGRWGKHYVRLLRSLALEGSAKLVGVCDPSPESLRRVAELNPSLPTRKDLEPFLVAHAADDPLRCDAVIVATPASTHAGLVERCLLAGKHCLVEKPLTLRPKTSARLVRLALEKGVALMVGHTFLFNDGVLDLAKRIKSEAEFGRLYYMYARRTNLGPIRSDTSCLWDLAVHDVSVFLFLMGGALPEKVVAVGTSLLADVGGRDADEAKGDQRCAAGLASPVATATSTDGDPTARADRPLAAAGRRDDVAFVALHYPGGVVCHAQASWLDPDKVRELAVVGSKQRVVFNDMQPRAPITVYERGVSVEPGAPTQAAHFAFTDGDVRMPKIDCREPLRAQLTYFLDRAVEVSGAGGAGGAAAGPRRFRSCGGFGLDVVRVLAAAEASMAAGSAAVPVPSLEEVAGTPDPKRRDAPVGADLGNAGVLEARSAGDSGNAGALEALRAKVAALEAENARLRAAADGARGDPPRRNALVRASARGPSARGPSAHGPSAHGPSAHGPTEGTEGTAPPGPCPHAAAALAAERAAASAKIPLVDLRANYAAVNGPDGAAPGAIDGAIARVLASCWFVGGPEVAAFEAAFAAHAGASFCVGVNSGTDAIALALRALGVGPGDEVITQANTFVATALAIEQTGARAVLIDCNPQDLMMDVSRLEAAVTPRTRAVVPVHLFGMCADMDAVLEVAGRHGLLVVEDAAQAHGAVFRGRADGAARAAGGRRAGSMGDAGCFSFYPGKNLGAFGDGGAVVTSDSQLADAIRAWRSWGARQKYRHETKGGNSRLDALQAAVLGAKLPHLDAGNAARRRLAGRYTALLRGSAACRRALRLPTPPPRCVPVWHLYVVRLATRGGRRGAGRRSPPPHRPPASMPAPAAALAPSPPARDPTPLAPSLAGSPLAPERDALASTERATDPAALTALAARRDALVAALHAQGIGAGVHYPLPLHKQRCFRRELGWMEHEAGRPLRESEAAAASMLSLPIFPEMDDAQQDRVVAALEAFFEKEA